MILRNPISLIGDFIGTIPAMIELSKHTNLKVIIDPSVAQLFERIPRYYNIQRHYGCDYCKSFDLSAAFALADKERKLHMIQSHFHFVGLPIPDNIPRPVMDFIPERTEVFDYILSPFSRSLPSNERWPQERWQQLVNELGPMVKCAMIGSSAHDNPNYLQGVTPVFDHSFNYVASLMRNATQGLISVVTGTSHLSYALGVKNWLFFNQGLWGKNPEAILLDKNIHDITVEEVLRKIL